MKIRVTIDTDECNFDSENEDSYNRGVVDIDKDGVARWLWKSPSYFVPFTDVEVLYCEHKFNPDTHKCYDCEVNEVTEEDIRMALDKKKREVNE